MITSVDVSKIEASRDNKEIISNMKFNIHFDSVKVEKEHVNVAFTFIASYEGEQGHGTPKEVGKLTIVGNVMSKEVQKDADEIQKTWTSKQTLPLKFAEDVINILNFECGARGTLIAYSIGFVAPLPISRAKLQDNQTQSSVS